MKNNQTSLKVDLSRRKQMAEKESDDVRVFDCGSFFLVIGKGWKYDLSK
jgi:hypothetical protein